MHFYWRRNMAKLRTAVRGYPPEAVLTIQQLADWLGVSRRTVQRLPIPVVRLGHRTLRYRGRDVLDYLERKAR